MSLSTPRPSSRASTSRRDDDAGDASSTPAIARVVPGAMPAIALALAAPWWHVKNHPTSGIAPWRLMEMLWRHRDAIDWTRSMARVVFLATLSMVNAVWALADGALWVRWRRTRIRDDPVFIIGHPRTGTTHAHNTLAMDEGRFGTCTTFDVGFPNGFLTSEWTKGALELMMDETRPMDNMELTMSSPQEDELATNILSGGASPYAAIMFMTEEERFRKFYELREDHEEYPIEPSELKRWKSAFLTFVKKLQYKRGEDKRLLLKSPVHTARVRLLREMFPRASFIFMSRHPYDVFRSAVNMADKYYWQCYFKEPTVAQVLEFILKQGEILHDAYIRDAAELPAEALYEIRFEDLDANLEGTMRKLYEHFGWDDFEDALAPKLRDYSESLRNFKKNSFSELDEETKKIVQRRWARWFTDLNYKT